MKQVIIIDDEPLAAALIREYVQGHADLRIAAICGDGFEGLKKIQEVQPDLIFLDVQMPRLSGLELLEVLDPSPPIIFTTAFDTYAVQAFESNAIDYLLKPVSKERFDTAIERWRNRMADPVAANPLAALRASVPMGQSGRIVVRSGHQIRMLVPDEIRYVEAYDDYVNIHIPGDCFLKKQTMQHMELMLEARGFVRIHRSYLVNGSLIEKIEPAAKGTYQVILNDKSALPVSRSGYIRLKNFLGL